MNGAVSRSPWQDAWRRLKKNKPALFGLAVLTALIALALAAPWITPYSNAEQNLELGVSPRRRNTGWAATCSGATC